MWTACVKTHQHAKFERDAISGFGAVYDFRSTMPSCGTDLGLGPNLQIFDGFCHCGLDFLAIAFKFAKLTVCMYLNLPDKFGRDAASSCGAVYDFLDNLDSAQDR